MRKKYGKKFRAKVALEAVRGDKTLAELSSEYKVHANVIGQWKKNLLENADELFEGKRAKRRRKKEQRKKVDALYRKVGKIEMENDWLKKKLGL
jgi:transposase-like protein